MAIVQTGSVLQFTGLGGGNTGTVSTTITVPADAELVVATWSGFGSANFFSTGSMTFTKGGADTAMTNIPGGDANVSFWMGAMFYLVLPDTGSNKTLKWDWAGAGAAGDASSICSVTFWKGIDTASPVRDSKGTQASGVPYTTASITAVTGDLIIAWTGFTNAASSEATINSWSNLTLLSQMTFFGSADGALATGSPSGNTTVAASTGTNTADGSIIAASFQAAAGGGAPPVTNLMPQIMM
jgi:hypothetical protein